MKPLKKNEREDKIMLRIVSLLVFATLLLSAHIAHAIPITIDISGEVTSASGSALPDTIYEGVSFNGTYTYDSSTSDSDTDPKWGEYEYDSPYGISIIIGGYEFSTAPDHVKQFRMKIGNDVLSNGVWDEYWVQSQYENISVPSLGFNIGSICWYLSDSTYDAISSDVLPLTKPMLTDWDQNKLYISGSDSGLGDITIEGIVTQAVLEPSTMLLLGFGAIFAKTRTRVKRVEQ